MKFWALWYPRVEEFQLFADSLFCVQFCSRLKEIVEVGVLFHEVTQIVLAGIIFEAVHNVGDTGSFLVCFEKVTPANFLHSLAKEMVSKNTHVLDKVFNKWRVGFMESDANFTIYLHSRHQCACVNMDCRHLFLKNVFIRRFRNWFYDDIIRLWITTLLNLFYIEKQKLLQWLNYE